MDREAKDSKKPKGQMSAYAFFMQATREEQKKNHGEFLSFSELSMQAFKKWKNLSDENRKIYKEMARKDSEKHQAKMRKIDIAIENYDKTDEKDEDDEEEDTD
ncbi:hypothetical protein HELRODRAFT_167607 [Helobdella robusta]|uniref:HMG box domain-containing protein n=1 Tax=Helobdella robusta TaxID=6412 RepID=T1EZJ7_HELRO|nr:hypothetical protein HELRODRAFT_167607 [Helobdella robusta]ESO11075.1 hypothetical protein HELRODRAFT_167607 [Helobdella robusta]